MLDTSKSRDVGNLWYGWGTFVSSFMPIAHVAPMWHFMLWVFWAESMLVADAAGSVGWLVCAPCICEGGGQHWCEEQRGDACWQRVLASKSLPTLHRSRASRIRPINKT